STGQLSAHGPDRWTIGPRPITRIDVIRSKGHARPAAGGALPGRWCCPAAVVGGGVLILCPPSTLKDWIDFKKQNDD
ncbi:MAG: hypothetical protein PVH87_24995, partial [Desulfobacteraceae bacterium]